MYVTDFENPQPFLVEELLRLHRDPGRNGDPGISREVENTSLFAVGSLGYREKLSEEVKASVARDLVANLEAAAGKLDEAALTLRAIGNTGNDGLLENVSPYLADRDESVRAAACEALRRMEAPTAQDRLIPTFEKDDSAKVRQSALKALREMPLTSGSAAWAREEVLRAGEPKEQVLVVELLGKTLSAYPSNEKALRDVLAANPPLPVKETICKYIAPK